MMRGDRPQSSSRPREIDATQHLRVAQTQGRSHPQGRDRVLGRARAGRERRDRSAAVSVPRRRPRGHRVLPRLLEPAGLPPGHAPAARPTSTTGSSTDKESAGLRNTRGILIGTARANPGKGIEPPRRPRRRGEDRAPAQRLRRARRSRDRRAHLDRRRRHAEDGELPLRVPEAPAARAPSGSRSSTCPRRSTTTTAASTSRSASSPRSTSWRKELQNLRADAMATSGYFIVETHGPQGRLAVLRRRDRRRGEPRARASRTWSTSSPSRTSADPETGALRTRAALRSTLVDRIVDLILTREKRGKQLRHGRPRRGPRRAASRTSYIADVAARRARPHLARPRSTSASWSRASSRKRYEERTGTEKKLTGVQLGYESRCAPPHAFDVMLGSQLGIGAYRALVEENLDGAHGERRRASSTCATCRSTSSSTRRR